MYAHLLVVNLGAGLSHALLGRGWILLLLGQAKVGANGAKAEQADGRRWDLVLLAVTAA